MKAWPCSSEGLALPQLARARAGEPPQDQAELSGAAHAVLIATHGPSLVAIAVLYGLPLVLVGSAVVVPAAGPEAGRGDLRPARLGACSRYVAASAVNRQSYGRVDRAGPPG